MDSIPVSAFEFVIHGAQVPPAAVTSQKWLALINLALMPFRGYLADMAGFQPLSHIGSSLTLQRADVFDAALQEFARTQTDIDLRNVRCHMLADLYWKDQERARGTQVFLTVTGELFMAELVGPTGDQRASIVLLHGEELIELFDRSLNDKGLRADLGPQLIASLRKLWQRAIGVTSSRVSHMVANEQILAVWQSRFKVEG